VVTQADVYVPTAEDLAAIAEQVWSSYVSDGVYADGAEHPLADAVTAAVSITGQWCGHVLIVTESSTARGIAAAMFALDSADVGDPEIRDAFGEMANIIGGNVKALLPEPSVLSLPQVDLEHGALSVPSAQLVSQADLRWDGQPVRISVWGNA